MFLQGAWGWWGEEVTPTIGSHRVWELPPLSLPDPLDGSLPKAEAGAGAKGRKGRGNGRPWGEGAVAGEAPPHPHLPHLPTPPLHLQPSCQLRAHILPQPRARGDSSPVMAEHPPS